MIKYKLGLAPGFILSGCQGPFLDRAEADCFRHGMVRDDPVGEIRISPTIYCGVKE